MSQQKSETSSLGAIECNGIMGVLPHRFPLLLVDRVLECAPGKHILGLKNVTRGEPFVAGAVRRDRGIPHLLVIEALAQLSVILAFKTLGLKPTGDELMFFAGIDSARFHNFAFPGEQILLRSEVRQIRRLVGRFTASAQVEGRLVVEVSMLAAIKPSGRTPDVKHVLPIPLDNKSVT